MKRLGLAIAFCFSLIAGAFAQGGMGPGPGTVHSSGAAYSGIGDTVSGWTTWASCARVFTAAQANTSTSLCDLVAVTGGAAVCTLRGSSSGFVDLAASYCAGTTPAAACAAASGGSCKVSKGYDQTGNALDWTQATLANMPPLTFSALNGLPGVSCTSAGAHRLDTPQTLTPTSSAGPMSFSSVAKRTANFTSKQAVIGAQPVQSIGIGFTASASTIGLFYISVVPTLGSVADNSFHAIQGVVSGASSVIAADGATSTGTATGSAPGASQGFRLCRDQGGGNPLDGVVMEFGLAISTAFSGANITAVDANQRSTSGYCAVNGCTLP